VFEQKKYTRRHRPITTEPGDQTRSRRLRQKRGYTYRTILQTPRKGWRIISTTMRSIRTMAIATALPTLPYGLAAKKAPPPRILTRPESQARLFTPGIGIRAGLLCSVLGLNGVPVFVLARRPREAVKERADSSGRSLRMALDRAGPADSLRDAFCGRSGRKVVNRRPGNFASFGARKPGSTVAPLVIARPWEGRGHRFQSPVMGRGRLQHKASTKLVFKQGDFENG